MPPENPTQDGDERGKKNNAAGEAGLLAYKIIYICAGGGRRVSEYPVYS
jgi:hypothetical protein